MKRIYRYWRFTSLECREAEEYLNQMAGLGLVLHKVYGFWPMAVFERADKEQIGEAPRYCVDLFLDEDRETDYRKLCYESGWEFVSSVWEMRIFRQRQDQDWEDVEAVPIQTDPQIETELNLKLMWRIQLKRVAVSVIWGGFFAAQWMSNSAYRNIYTDFDYERYTSWAGSLLLIGQIIFWLIAIGYLVSSLVGCLRIQRDRALEKRKEIIRGWRKQDRRFLRVIGMMAVVLLVSKVPGLAAEGGFPPNGTCWESSSLVLTDYVDDAAGLGEWQIRTRYFQGRTDWAADLLYESILSSWRKGLAAQGIDQSGSDPSAVFQTLDGGSFGGERAQYLARSNILVVQRGREVLLLGESLWNGNDGADTIDFFSEEGSAAVRGLWRQSSF